MSLDCLIGEDSYLRLHPATFYDNLVWEDLRVWCHFQSRYGLPTLETIAWLQELIGDRKAIEIGSGSGDLARHLGIPGTDSWCQTWPDVAAYYNLLRQPTIRYPESVECLDATHAVQKYRPEVVIASWVTEYIDPALPVPPQGGSVYGVKEDAIVAAGIEYVLIGNQATHGRKRIMALPHEEFALPFLRSRGHDRSGDRVYVWNRRSSRAIGP